LEFRIRNAALEAIVAQARDASPRECCGLLIGTGHAIDEAVLARNLAEGSTRFLIDPRDHIEARRVARRRSLDVLGFYHSHPRSAAWPSAADVAEAAYPDAVYLIVSLAGTSPEAKLFRIERETVAELRLVRLG
jgi:proteasome lid subunit RPN8/RPN11